MTSFFFFQLLHNILVDRHVVSFSISRASSQVFVRVPTRGSQGVSVVTWTLLRRTGHNLPSSTIATVSQLSNSDIMLPGYVRNPAGCSHTTRSTLQTHMCRNCKRSLVTDSTSSTLVCAVFVCLQCQCCGVETPSPG